MVLNIKVFLKMIKEMAMVNTILILKIGIYYFENGSRYEGEFYNDLFTGKGKLLFLNLKLGTYFYVNGDWYEGDYVKN